MKFHLAPDYCGTHLARLSPGPRILNKPLNPNNHKHLFIQSRFAQSSRCCHRTFLSKHARNNTVQYDRLATQAAQCWCDRCCRWSTQSTSIWVSEHSNIYKNIFSTTFSFSFFFLIHFLLSERCIRRWLWFIDRQRATQSLFPPPNPIKSNVDIY